MARVAIRAGLVAAVVAAVVPARAQGSGFRNAIAYVDARETFRRLGYTPYFMPGADLCDPNDRRCYPELVACAKSRTWACTYTWRRGRTIVEVETRYDDPVVARTDCIVNCTRDTTRRAAQRADHAAASAPPPSDPD